MTETVRESVEGVAAGEFKREIRFTPAWHRVHEDTRKDYGVHGVEIHFYLTGDRGTVQFKMNTDWMLPETHDWWRQTGRLPKADRYIRDRPMFPMAADLGYHSPTPHYDDQFKTPAGECEFIDGDCYYDGSGLNAEPVLARLIAEGHDGVWAALEDYYAQVFSIATAKETPHQ